MDCLVAYYSEKFKTIDGNVFEVFSKFYEADLSPIKLWLETQAKKKTVKDDAISVQHRREGNTFYAKKDLVKSLEYYTRSLCFATPNSQEYGMALANRSAVSFEMKEFHHCLKDIDLCFNTSYPADLRVKIYLRKAECYAELKQKEPLRTCLRETMTFLNSKEEMPENATKVMEKLNSFLLRLGDLTELKTANSKLDDSHHEIVDFPEGGESECLAFASNKVRLSYNKTRGRHILANTNIHRGDLLFIEKAFIFAPVFNENKEFSLFKCYNCLRDIVSCVPCNGCTVCVYCDEQCQNESWTTCHQWECEGMQANIWFDLGIAFPAFRAMVKGALAAQPAPAASTDAAVGPEEDVKRFGDRHDNYRYFNRLLSNIFKNKNVAPYAVMAGVVVAYLEKYTDFFPWYLKQPNCPKSEAPELVGHVGGLITKHIAQLACNSSTIEHWSSSSPELLFPDVMVSIACGIFPSSSMMNHACRPNVMYYFICDTIIVKALEDIPKDGEVLNCYGIDYRGMRKEQRQFNCRKFYHFECKCAICSNPANEINMLESYLCPNCKGQVPEISSSVISACVKCGEKFHLKPFRKINKEAQKYLESKSPSNPLELLIKSLKIREKILYKHHKDFEEVYYRLYTYCVEHGDAENMFKYFHLWLENEKARRGSNSRGIGTKLYEAALAILHCLQNGHPGQPKNCTNLKEFLQNVEHMIKEAKVILNLHYPPYITSRLSKKIQFISTK